jgi:hypothetical protein
VVSVSVALGLDQALGAHVGPVLLDVVEAAGAGQAVPANQTGAASGMNTVLRTLGGALGGQVSATFVVAGTAPGGLPALTGFTKTFVMGALVLAGCVIAGLAIPARARTPIAQDMTATSAE